MPDGIAKQAVGLAAGRFDSALGQFVLAFADELAADEPGVTSMHFLISTYRAAASASG